MPLYDDFFFFSGLVTKALLFLLEFYVFQKYTIRKAFLFEKEKY